MELAKSLHFIKIIESNDEPAKREVIKNIKSGLKEVKLFKKGKLKTMSANDFLNEL